MTGALQIRKTITDRQENLLNCTKRHESKFHQFLTIHETDHEGHNKDKTKIQLVNPGNFLQKLHQVPLPLCSLFRHNVRKEHIQKVEM